MSYIQVVPAYARNVWYYTILGPITATKNEEDVPLVLFAVKDGKEIMKDTPTLLKFDRMGRYKILWTMQCETETSAREADIKINYSTAHLIGEPTVVRTGFVVSLETERHVFYPCEEALTIGTDKEIVGLNCIVEYLSS